MHTFYIPPAQWGRHMELSGQEAHHLGRVLRLRAGEEVLLLDGEDDDFTFVLRMSADGVGTDDAAFKLDDGGIVILNVNIR